MVGRRSTAPLRLLPLKNDFVFKLVFGDKRRVDLLTAFLQADIADITGLTKEEIEKL